MDLPEWLERIYSQIFIPPQGLFLMEDATGAK